MRINWGYRIAFLYMSFTGMIIFLITRSVNEKIDLVTPEYYSEELKYQEKIESIERNNLLLEPVSVETGSDGIIIGYPAKPEGKNVTGSILLFRPSDQSLDRKYEINSLTGSNQLIPSADLQHGQYRVEVKYSIEGNEYFTDKEVFIYKKP